MNPMIHPLKRFILLSGLLVYGLLSHDALATVMEFSGTLQPGTAILLTLKELPPNAHLQGTLNDHPFPITPQGVAIIALDMEQQEKQAHLRVVITPPNGKPETLTKTFKISKRKYKEEHLSLPKKKVDLNQADNARAGKETAAIKATYTLRDGQTGFEKGFTPPVIGRFSGVFGSRRILNGKPRTPHNGVDVAAPKGTPVKTIAPGQVVLVGKNYFFTGNTLVIHHGHGVISLYAHLNDIQVESGQWVSTNTTIGTVGMTGRATGPHLHWGILIRGARVDPKTLPGMK